MIGPQNLTFAGQARRPLWSPRGACKLPSHSSIAGAERNSTEARLLVVASTRNGFAKVFEPMNSLTRDPKTPTHSHNG